MSEENVSIFTALAIARGKMKQPKLDSKGRTGKNGAREYKYASLAAVLDTIVGPLSEVGVFVTQGLDTYDVLTTEAHLGELSTVLDRRRVCRAGSSQEQGSAETYAKRYALCTVFGLAGMDDDDGEGAQTQPKPKTDSKPAPKQPETPKEDPFDAFRVACTKAKQDGRIDTYGAIRERVEAEIGKGMAEWDAADLRRACGIVAMTGTDKVSEPEPPLAEEDIPF